MHIPPEGESFYLYINNSEKWKKLPLRSIYLCQLTIVEAQATSSDETPTFSSGYIEVRLIPLRSEPPYGLWKYLN